MSEIIGLEDIPLDKEVGALLADLLRAQIERLKERGLLLEGLGTMARVIQEQLTSSDVQRYYGHVIAYPDVTEYLVRAVTAAIEYGGSGHYILENARHGYQCLESFFERDCETGRRIPIWYGVDTGHERNFDDACARISKGARHRFYDDEVRELLRPSINFVSVRNSLQLVAVMPAEIGMPNGGKLSDIVSNAKRHDLYIVPPDTPLQVMLQHDRREPKWLELTFATTPVNGSLFRMSWDQSEENAIVFLASAMHPIGGKTRLLFYRKSL